MLLSLCWHVGSDVCHRSMVFQVSTEIHDRFLASAVGICVSFSLFCISMLSLQLAICSALFVGVIFGAVMHHLLMLLCTAAAVPGNVTHIV